MKEKTQKQKQVKDQQQQVKVDCPREAQTLDRPMCILLLDITVGRCNQLRHGAFMHIHVVLFICQNSIQSVPEELLASSSGYLNDD